MQRMLDTCSLYGKLHDILFNAKKTAIMAVNHRFLKKPTMHIDNQIIAWVDHLNYLGISFTASTRLNVDINPIKRKFYAVVNSVFSRNSNLEDPVKVHLVNSYCLPILVYCIGALELDVHSISSLGVCWNNAFRKIFHYSRHESVKLLQFFFGCMDFQHVYDLARIRFINSITVKLPYLSLVCQCHELQFRTQFKLCNVYDFNGCSVTGAVHEHFKSVVMNRN